jgi:hypothetical protein
LTTLFSVDGASSLKSQIRTNDKQSMITRAPKIIFPLLFIAGCSAPTQFSLIENPVVESASLIYENTYNLKQWSKQFPLAQGDVNKTTVNFRVFDSNNNSVSTLPNGELSIFENNYPISNYTLSKKSSSTLKNVDVAFVFDVTGSMKTTIDDAKSQITKFVIDSRAKGLAIRFCLITFGDYTLKQCNKFYDTSPQNPNSELETKQFLKEISELRAISGINDPGGTDYNENPMRAIIDASNAPWDSRHQHFVILLTDDGFLYSPGNSGSVGSKAPTFPQVLASIDDKNLRIFAATYNYPGYLTDFKLGGQTYKSIVNQSSGEWFDYGDLISKKINLGTIFDRIGIIVDTTFQAYYELNGETPVPSWLPLADRDIRLILKSSSLKIADVAIESNLPNGSSEKQKIFKLSSKKIKKSSLRVSIGGQPLLVGFLIDDNDNLILPNHFSVDSQIQVEFILDDPLEAYDVTPIVLLRDDLDVDRLDVVINDKIIDRKNFSVSTNVQNGKNFFVFKIERSLFDSKDDAYDVNRLSKMDLRIQQRPKLK